MLLESGISCGLSSETPDNEITALSSTICEDCVKCASYGLTTNIRHHCHAQVDQSTHFGSGVGSLLAPVVVKRINRLTWSRQWCQHLLHYCRGQADQSTPICLCQRSLPTLDNDACCNVVLGQTTSYTVCMWTCHQHLQKKMQKCHNHKEIRLVYRLLKFHTSDLSHNKYFCNSCAIADIELNKKLHEIFFSAREDSQTTGDCWR